jgi:hypothetical protein
MSFSLVWVPESSVPDGFRCMYLGPSGAFERSPVVQVSHHMAHKVADVVG